MRSRRCSASRRDKARSLASGNRDPTDPGQGLPDPHLDQPRRTSSHSGPSWAFAEPERHEGWDGHKGAPRVLFASLMRMAELSGTTGRIPREKQKFDDDDDVVTRHPDGTVTRQTNSGSE